MTVAPVDYESLDSLTRALQGQDAVVSTLGSAAASVQLNLIEAASKVGAKRFIPSEFGSDTQNPKTAALPVFKDKLKVQKVLEETAATPSGMTYTLVCNGIFLDWGISAKFIMNLKEKSINLYDGGERPFSTTSLPTIGTAVAGILKHPEETKNRAVFVQDTATTLKTMEAVGKKATGTDVWTETVVSLDDQLAKAWAELKKEKPNPKVFIMNFLQVAIWGKDYGGYFKKTDNELLGIKEMSDDELQSLVDGLASQAP